MTDEHLDRMVRDADPYRPHAVQHLDGAAQHLLEEIMSTPTLEPVAEPPAKRPRTRRTLLSGLASAGVAAAVLAVIFTGSVMNVGGSQDRESAPADTPAGNKPITDWAMVLKAAEENPRLLIDQPGWKATTVYGFLEDSGTISFSKDDQELEMNWYPANVYGSFHEDRLSVSKPEPVKVDGWPAELFTYNAGDFAVMLTPREGSFVELRTGGAWTRSAFDKILTRVVRVDARTWLAALPAEIVKPERAKEQAAKILTDVPLPPGFDVTALTDLGPNDAYQFGARVTSRVGCAWISEWLRAKKAGDDAALQRASDALRSSHRWPVLQEMSKEGDWSEVFWETADKVVAGNPPPRYRESLGCE
ncbi:hypothetical protein Q3V37_29945 [Micromonospora profundi]|uniref:Uncharacterized protein n=1 Tax=Micromonospora profundi TaxID=1420889 RepID=A0AAJ6KYJ2_9ACTN|nr:hypothetical protein [Micromonospora profundi]WLS45524.1 hypothetical protein Q3V37_29945 [Micromonospora profundi]